MLVFKLDAVGGFERGLGSWVETREKERWVGKRGGATLVPLSLLKNHADSNSGETK